MNEIPWFERNLVFGKAKEFLPYFVDRLAGTGVRIEAKVNGVPEKILSERWNGKWSVKDNIGHLAEVDEIANKRMHEMIAGISTMSPAVFEPTKDYNKMPIEEVINYFLKTRNENIARYKNLTDAELLKSSLHPRLKLMMTPVDLAWFDAEHDDHHLVKISFILEKQN